MTISSFIKGLKKTLQQKKIELTNSSLYSDGHYYSAIPSYKELKENENSIWESTQKDEVRGVNLNTEVQTSLGKSFEKFYPEMPFPLEKETKYRYFLKNRFYSFTDGITLYSMIRNFKPTQIIEVGSGYSSALMLDTNNLFFNGEIQLTFIEPFPERLYSLINDTDKKNSKILVQKVQSVDLSVFEKLETNDILFIDSSHVAKTGSDLNFILFEILPKLNPGVIIHFHDIFFPFEYPKNWIFEGRNWNENYFLKSFLMYNSCFEILFFSDYLHKFHKDTFLNMPLCYKNWGGNLWMVKK